MPTSGTSHRGEASRVRTKETTVKAQNKAVLQAFAHFEHYLAVWRDGNQDWSAASSESGAHFVKSEQLTHLLSEPPSCREVEEREAARHTILQEFTQPTDLFKQFSSLKAIRSLLRDLGWLDVRKQWNKFLEGKASSVPEHMQRYSITGQILERYRPIKRDLFLAHRRAIAI